MRTQKIYVHNPLHYFNQILKESEFRGVIPSNYIINKKRPGLGATTTELLAERDSIIIEPYISVIEVKKEKYPKEICAIMGKLTPLEVHEKLSEHLNSKLVRFKKIMTTPESFPKVIKVLGILNPSYRQTYFLLLDESEKWITQAIFREKILLPLEEFFLFKNKAMISATPITPSHPKFEADGFKILDLVPTFDYKKEIKIVTTNNIRTSARNLLEHLAKDQLPIFIFTNCRTTIFYLSQLDIIKPDFKVFCAEDLNVRFFQKQSLPNVQYSNKDQQYAKFNFATSKFYCAVDIDLTTEAHVLMITNIQQTAHSIIDPATDSIQIYGRCRERLIPNVKTGVKTITHLTNIYPNHPSSTTKEQEQDLVKKEIYHISKLNELKDLSTDENVKQVAESFIQKQHASVIFRKDGKVDSFKQDNLIDARNVKRLYYSTESLLEEYEMSDFFIPKWLPVSHASSDLDRMAIAKKRNKDKRIEVATQLHRLSELFDLEAITESEYSFDVRKLMQTDQFIVNAYFLLGYDLLVENNFSKTIITKEIINYYKSTGLNMLMIDTIISTFPLHIKLYCDDIEKKLQSIFDEFIYGEFPNSIRTAKASDIEKFFECHLYVGKEIVDGKPKSWYKLFAAKFRISEKLEYLTNR